MASLFFKFSLLLLLFPVARGGIPENLCKRLLLKGLTEEFVPYVQLGGVYELQNFTWNEFPVFKMANVYLYYHPRHELYLGLNSTHSIGMGATLTSFDPNENWIRDEKFPYKWVINQWAWQSHLTHKYQMLPPDAAIQLQCVPPLVQKCTSGLLYLTGLIIQHTVGGSTVVLNDPDQSYYEIVPNVFQGNRPVYRLINGSRDFYLYFYPKDNSWQVFFDYTSSNCAMYVVDTAYSPEYITSEWFVYDYGEWRNDSSVQVRCKGTKLQEGQDCGTGNMCLNNSTCSVSDRDEMVCDCASGWFGARCEHPSAKCPDISFDESPSGASLILNSGTWQSSLATYGCREGLKPEYYLSVCVADVGKGDSAAPTGHWLASGECHDPWTSTSRKDPDDDPWAPTSTTDPWDDPWAPTSTIKPWDETSWVWIVVIVLVATAQLGVPFFTYIGMVLHASDVYTNKSLKLFTKKTKMRNDLRKENHERQDAVDYDSLGSERYTATLEALREEYKRDLKQLEAQFTEEEANIKEKQVSFCRSWSLCFQISIWFWIPFALLCYAGQYPLYSRTFEVLSIMAYVVILVGYFWIALEMMCSREAQYLSRLGDSNSVADTIAVIHKEAPTLVMTAECYHYETQTRLVTTTDYNGNPSTSTETYEERVVTHRDAEVIRYRSWKDTSKDKVTFVSKHRVTKIRLGLVVIPGDEESRQKMDSITSDFIDRNEDLDEHMDYNLEKDVPGFVKRIAAYTDAAHKPFWMSRVGLFVATSLAMSWAYRWVFRACTGRAEYTVRKEIFFGDRPTNGDSPLQNYDATDPKVKQKVRNSLLAMESDGAKGSGDQATQSGGKRKKKRGKRKQKQEETTDIIINPGKQETVIALKARSSI